MPQFLHGIADMAQINRTPYDPLKKPYNPLDKFHRTIADALDVLSTQGFKSSSTAKIRLTPISMPWGERAWSIDLSFQVEGNKEFQSEAVFRASDGRTRAFLTCSSKFRAKKDGSFRLFETSCLEGALVSYNQQNIPQVMLTDGATLSSVEVVPSTPKIVDESTYYKIVYALVKYNKAERLCFIDPYESLPTDLRGTLICAPSFNLNELPRLKIPLLKQLAAYYSELFPDQPPVPNRR